MTTKQQIEADLKTAMLAGDKETVTVLRGLKGAVLNVEIQKGVRDPGLPEEEVVAVLAKEAKKRQESADLYIQGNRPELAEAETAQKAIIEKYLPQQMSDDELAKIVDAAITETGATNMQQMGQVIGKVKQQTAGLADGGRIATMVKEKLA